MLLKILNNFQKVGIRKSIPLKRENAKFCGFAHLGRKENCYSLPFYLLRFLGPNFCHPFVMKVVSNIQEQFLVFFMVKFKLLKSYAGLKFSASFTPWYLTQALKFNSEKIQL